MATKERVQQLSGFCEQWRQILQDSEKRRDDLISLKSQRTMIFQSDTEEDLLPTLIEEADRAVNIHKQCLTRLESVRDLAIAGEDV